jgi:hypothetical protein
MADYRQSGGTWFVVDGGREYVFASEQEARQTMAKLATAQAIVRTVQSLAAATDSATDLEKEYFDVQGAGWVDGDVEALGITAAQLGGCLTLLQQFAKLMTAQATTPLDNTATLNSVRRVQA